MLGRQHVWDYGLHVSKKQKGIRGLSRKVGGKFVGRGAFSIEKSSLIITEIFCRNMSTCQILPWKCVVSINFTVTFITLKSEIKYILFNIPYNALYLIMYIIYRLINVIYYKIILI